jgi:hypothetical protein
MYIHVYNKCIYTNNPGRGDKLEGGSRLPLGGLVRLCVDPDGHGILFRRAKRAWTLDSICVVSGWVATAQRGSRRPWVTILRRARRAGVCSAREALRNARLDLRFFLGGSRRLCVDPGGHGLYLLGARSALFSVRRVKRACIFSAREALRHDRLDLRFPLGGSRRLWVGRGWFAATRRQIHKLYVGGSRGSRAPGT